MTSESPNRYARALRRLGQEQAAMIVESMDERDGPPAAVPPEPTTRDALAGLLTSDPKAYCEGLRQLGETIPHEQLRALDAGQMARLLTIDEPLVEASLRAGAKR